jgi:hypothetical protein
MSDFEPNATTMDCNACEPASPATPQVIFNRAGLPAVAYRIGTYASFRQAMIAAIHRQPPLAAWTARRDDDVGIALMSMWAYVADILTFYQERTANEAYLRTALLRSSLRRLAALLDYRPAPGVAASVYLAYLLQPPTPAVSAVQLKPGLRAQSTPGPDEKPQKFETVEARSGRFAWNLLPVKQFQSQPPLTTSTRTLFLQGKITSIKPGDVALIVGDERRDFPADERMNERWDARAISAVEVVGEQTRIAWDEPLGAAERNILPGSKPRLYIMRKRAALFGVDAPAKTPAIAQVVTKQSTSGTPPVTTTTTTITYAPSDGSDWDFLRPSAGAVIDLNAEYPKLIKDEWALLVRPGYVELYRVKTTAAHFRSDYGLSATVTRLTLDTAENLDRFYTTNLRRSAVLFGGEEFALGQLPHATPVEGQTIEVMGDQRALERGRPLIISGRAVGDESGDVVGEVAFVDIVSFDGTVSVIRLADPLHNSYVRAGVELYANVLLATHGESTRETLGGGDGASAFQSFPLKKAPVTFIPQAGAPNGAANSLQVRVDDILWREVRSFYQTGLNDPVYTTRSDEQGKMTVHFGDGVHGRRLPTGRSNVTALYRQGIGRAGLVNARAITTALDRPLGVKGVVNPLASEGGAEAEPPESVRVNAPAAVRTFGRIVSLTDFEDAARAYAGIAKARAALVWEGDEQVVSLTVAGDRGEEVTPGSVLFANLLADLDSRRDPNRALRLGNYTLRPLLLDVVLLVDAPTFLPENVEAAARASLIAFFDFDNLDLGQAVSLAQIHAALHAVAGVVAVDINRFVFKPPSGLTVAQRRQFYVDRRRQGAPEVSTLDGQGFPGADVQSFAAALPNELLGLADANVDLTVTTTTRFA